MPDKSGDDFFSILSIVSRCPYRHFVTGYFDGNDNVIHINTPNCALFTVEWTTIGSASWFIITFDKADMHSEYKTMNSVRMLEIVTDILDYMAGDL